MAPEIERKQLCDSRGERRAKALATRQPGRFDHETYSGQTWETDFNVGGWRIDVLEAFDPLAVGVGGENFEYVVLGHICDQTLLSLD